MVFVDDCCIDSIEKLAPPAGFEPAYHALTVRCFAYQPQGNVARNSIAQDSIYDQFVLLPAMLPLFSIPVLG